MTSFAELRKKNSLAAMQEKLKKLNQKANNNKSLEEDPTYWSIRHIYGEDFKGKARIRFLPAPPGEDDPFIKYYEYYHKGPKGWYRNLSRQTLSSNEKDPAYFYNGKIFGNSSLSDTEKKKMLINRNVFYVANILVLEDPAAPENEGKVFRFQFGNQIFNLINEALFPDDEDKEPVNVFDPIEGADFVLLVRPKAAAGKTLPTYEKSYFDAPSELCDIEDFDEIWKKTYSLKEIISEDKFKSYEVLCQEFNRAMGISTSDYDDDAPDDEIHQSSAPSFVGKSKASAKQNSSLSEELDDEIPHIGKDDEDDVPFKPTKSSKKPVFDDDDEDDILDEALKVIAKKAETDRAKASKKVVVDEDDADDDDDWFERLKKK